MAVTLVIQLYTARVFLNTLGASDYGVYTLVSGVIFMFGFLQDTLTRSSLRYLCFYKEKDDILNQKRVYSISIILHVIISLFIILNLYFISDFLFSGFLKIEEERIDAARLVYYFMIASFTFTVISVPFDSILNANENMFYYSIIGILESVLKLVLAIYLPYANNDKLVVYAFVLSIITITSLIIKRVYCHIKYEECEFRITYYNKTLAKKMISYAGWNFFTSITSLLSFNSIPLLLNYFFGTIINAAQGIAGQVNGVISQFSSNMMKALSPTITKSGSNNNIDKMIIFSMTGTKLSFLLVCLLVVPIIVECSYILKLWLINVPAWTETFCTLVLLNTLAYQLISVFADCIYANDKIKNYCIIKGILNILPVFLGYFAFAKGGSPYMVYVILILIWDIIGGVVIIGYNKKIYGLQVSKYIKDLLVPSISIFLVSFILGRSVSCLIAPSLIRLLLSVMITTFSIIILSCFLLFNNEEKKLIWNIFATTKDKIYMMINNN